MEHVELNLDGCGKHTLVFSFLMLQIASICTFCLNYYQFYSRTCNPVVYRLNKPLYTGGYDISYDRILQGNVVLSIMLKFGAVVCLRLALEEYQNLSSNTSYFLFAMMFTLAPTSLLAPLYTYDHVNCMSKSFLVPQSIAEIMAFCSVVLSVFPFVFSLLVPHTWKACFCCKKGYVAALAADDAAVQNGEERPGAKKSVTARLSWLLHVLKDLYTFLLMLLYLVCMLAVHLCQYRIFAGGFLLSGGVNEIWALIELMIITCLYRSKDVTQDEIQEKMDVFESKL